MSNTNKYLKKHRNVAIILFVVAICVVCGFILYARNTNDTLQTTPSGQKINLNDPTKEEKDTGNKIKSEIVDKEASQNNTSKVSASGKNSVMPTITYADQYSGKVEVGAFISGIFEDGGTCTLRLQKEGAVQTTSVSAIKGATSVNCPVMLVDRSSLSPGIWSATVSYSSQSSEGQSTPRSVEVQ